MLRNPLVLIALAFMALTQYVRAADDLLVDGVPLPANATIAAPTVSSTVLQQRWSGVWVGAWDGKLKHILHNFSAFENAGGRGTFFEFDMPPGKGHFVLGRPDLWSGPIDRYLKSLGTEEKH